MGGAWVGTPTCKMRTFFQIPLAIAKNLMCSTVVLYFVVLSAAALFSCIDGRKSFFGNQNFSILATLKNSLKIRINAISKKIWSLPDVEILRSGMVVT